MQQSAVSSFILLGTLAFLFVVIDARPEVIQTFSNPGILGVGANQQIIDYKPNGVEQVIDVNNGLLGLGATTSVRDYVYNPYAYNNYVYRHNFGFYPRGGYGYPGFINTPIYQLPTYPTYYGKK